MVPVEVDGRDGDLKILRHRLLRGRIALVHVGEVAEGGVGILFPDLLRDPVVQHHAAVAHRPAARRRLPDPRLWIVRPLVRVFGGHLAVEGRDREPGPQARIPHGLVDRVELRDDLPGHMVGDARMREPHGDVMRLAFRVERPPVRVCRQILLGKEPLERAVADDEPNNVAAVPRQPVAPQKLLPAVPHPPLFGGGGELFVHLGNGQGRHGGHHLAQFRRHEPPAAQPVEQFVDRIARPVFRFAVEPDAPLGIGHDPEPEQPGLRDADRPEHFFAFSADVDRDPLVARRQRVDDLDRAPAQLAEVEGEILDRLTVDVAALLQQVHSLLRQVFRRRDVVRPARRGHDHAVCDALLPDSATCFAPKN